MAFILFIFLAGFLFYRICWILLIAFLMSLQVVSHLPLLKVVIPANALKIFEDIVPIAAFDWAGLDFFRTRWFARLIFTFDD